MAKATKPLGMAITFLGLALLLYALYAGATGGSIGSAGGMDSTAWAAVIGWFAILVGPALWEGETPASIKRKLKR